MDRVVTDIVVVLRSFNSLGHWRQDAVDKSLGVGSLRSYPGLSYSTSLLAPFGHNTQRGRQRERQSDRNRPPMLEHRRPKKPRLHWDTATHLVVSLTSALWQAEFLSPRGFSVLLPSVGSLFDFRFRSAISVRRLFIVTGCLLIKTGLLASVAFLVNLQQCQNM